MEEKTKKDTKKILKKWWFGVTISIVIIILLIGIILFFINKIPSKYYGTFVSYDYFDGFEYKATVKITPLSIKTIREGMLDGKYTTKEEKCKYLKKNNNLIIQDGNDKAYVIVEDDCLYISSSKDISSLKEYELGFYNIKSDKANLYKIKNKSEGLVNSIEQTMNTWARELVYETVGREMNNLNFYINESDKRISDETNLNTYIVYYDTCGGELNLYYDRETQKLNKIYFSGSILESAYSTSSLDKMDIYDVYDSRAILLSLMYILGNKDNIELNQDVEDTNSYSKALKDLSYRTSVAKEYDELFTNKKTDENFNDRYTYSLKNDKYDIDYTSWISSSEYSISGIISFSINLM